MTVVNVPVPRWVWWLLGISAVIVAAIVSAPFLAIICWSLLRGFDERPRPFEVKVQLEGAAIWNSGTEADTGEHDAHDCTVEKDTLQFARTGQPRENVDIIESAKCIDSYKIYQVGWFAFGDGTYLRVGDDTYGRISQGRWRKYSADWKNEWSLSHLKTKEGQVIHKRETKDRTFYRVYQLPQKVDGKWILREQKSSPRKHNKSPKLRR